MVDQHSRIFRLSLTLDTRGSCSFIQGSRQDQVHHGGGERDELERGVQAEHGVEEHGGVGHDVGALLGRPQHLRI